MSEVNGGVKGITYDTSRFEITTEVTDNRDGTLTAEHSLKDGQSDGITFENKYEITQGTSVYVGASRSSPEQILRKVSSALNCWTRMEM